MKCSEDEPIRALSGHPVRGMGFTLVELLVSISIISLLAGILVPVLGRVREKAFEVQSMNNLRQIGTNLLVYANDSQGFFPPSVATVGDFENWTWYDPRRLVGSTQRTPRNRRSMSMYLQDYLNVEALHCPSAPDEYKYLKEMWEAGDEWDNPDTPQEKDPMSGSYCYFWGYDSGLSWIRANVSSGGQGGRLMVVSTARFWLVISLGTAADMILHLRAPMRAARGWSWE